MRCLFLYNPNSGKGKIKEKLALVEKMLKRKYDEVVLCATESGTDMEARAREGAECFDAVVFSGGDGTFNNVLHGIGEKDVQLGYIPAGTANDVARSLGIPRSVKGALNVVLKGRSQNVDCMRVNGAYYAMYVAAAGAFTSVTYNTPQKSKRLFGRAAYVAEGLKNGMGFGSFPLKITCGESETVADGVVVLVMSGRTIAGFPVNKKASMQDGVLEAVIVKRAPKKRFRFAAIATLVKLFLFGDGRKQRDIILIRGNKLRIETDESVLWDFDGEKGSLGSVEIELCPRRVKLFVPRKKKI